MAEKQSSKDRLKEITAGIEDGIKDLFRSGNYARYLQTMSRFHRYSVNNQVLIHMQNPDATLVAGFSKWKKQFGRNVIKGQHGIKIIAPTPYKKKIEQEKLDPDTKLPMLDEDGRVIVEEKTVQIPMYRAVTVFDVSQTEGRPLPQLAHDLDGNVANYEVFMEALRRSSPVPISIEEMAENMDGYFNLERQAIAVRQGMSEVQTVSAAVHEMSHALLHNKEEAGDSYEEVQAESISFAVCAYYGIATGENSFGYIASWSKDKTLPELRESLEVINKTADRLINNIDRNFAEIVKEREAARAMEPPVEEAPEPPADVPPDPAISVEARNAYGYTDDAMLPLTKDCAMELFERDVPVYLLYGDNTEAMAFEAQEILSHDGIFGIDREDWEKIRADMPIVQVNRWEEAFRENPADSYCIYQLRDDPSLAELRFMGSRYLAKHGKEPDFANYAAVYSGTLPSDGGREDKLDDVYVKFNANHPQDFAGHSLSVSDMVVLRRNGAVSCHYVDNVGFKEYPSFLPHNYLKNAEMQMEDDYGMLDGIINNGAKEQPETKAKAPDLSALFAKAQRTVREKPESGDGKERPSVLAKLHAPMPPRSEKTAQAKSAERDLI